MASQNAPSLTCSFGLAVLAFSCLPNCATIVSGTKQDITLNSNPPGADVRVFQGRVIGSVDGFPEVASGNTPVVVSLQRDKQYTVIAEAPGYKQARMVVDQNFNGWVLGNIIFGWILGGAIDYLSGAWWRLNPDTIALRLHPEEVKKPADSGISLNTPQDAETKPAAAR